jgi:MerR family mercuric resistance operon transcriptional regulator
MRSERCCVSLTNAQPCAEARAVATTHLQDVRAKIADLKRMERVLKDVVAQCGDGTLPECPLIEALFRGPSSDDL